MFELLRSPWNVCFDSLISQADHSLIICSPYIGKNPCEKIKNRASQWSEAFSFTILTDLSCDNLISGVTDIVSISSIVEKFPNTEVRFLPSLHAKIYLADDLKAVVTSANMTDSGLMRNFEYGVLFSDISTVQSIKEDVLSYASVGSAVDLFQLRKFTEITLELRDIRRLAEKNLKSKLNKEFKRRVEKAEEEFIRVRVGGQHLHTIFSQTIKYILNSGSASTIQLHQTIQRIHPDLCDDNIDRIIDGKHFGKKWKHAVRTAQQHLKKRGEIELLNGYWRLC